jgi:hypothetical protein
VATDRALYCEFTLVWEEGDEETGEPGFNMNEMINHRITTPEAMLPLTRFA